MGRGKPSAHYPANEWTPATSLASAGSHPVSPPQRLFGAVLVGVRLGGFVGEMRGVEMVSVGGVRVMRGFFVRTGVVMFRGFLVMACRMFVMLRRFPMMLGCLLGHLGLLFREGSTPIELRSSVPVSGRRRLSPIAHRSNLAQNAVRSNPRSDVPYTPTTAESRHAAFQTVPYVRQCGNRVGKFSGCSGVRVLPVTENLLNSHP